jgi:ribosomal protein L11 methyltransferase
MAFIEITIDVDESHIELLSDVLLELGALAVTIEDRYQGSPKEQMLFNEPDDTRQNNCWQHNRLKILVQENTNIKKLFATLTQLMQHTYQYKIEKIDDQNWVLLSQNMFQPIKITDDCYIVPSWHKIPNNILYPIILDPGVAFGTGSHSTTFMCLQWICKNVNSNYSLLDYGCGSGILAIVAKKLGANLVYGVDIDDQAITTSINNAKQNNTDIHFTNVANIDNSGFDIVIANILSNPLKILAPILAKRTNKYLVLSGVLEIQSAELINLYSQYGIKLQLSQATDGWALLVGTK